jgi:putative lipoprotein
MVAPKKLRLAAGVFAVSICWIPMRSMAQSGAQPAAQSGAGSKDQATQVLRGSVVYRQRIALPPDAVVRVTIEDVTHADAAVKTIGEEDIPGKGHQIPVKFEVKYNPADIDPAHRYNLRAKITSEGRLMFTSTNSYPVLTQGAPANNVTVELEQVSSQYGQVPSTESASHPPLNGTQWKLTELNGKAPGSDSQGVETPPASITLDESAHRVSGTGGCNRIMGPYEVDGRSLHFKSTATTMMACAGEVMEQERGFLEALAATRTYRIHGSTLQLLGKDGKVLARLEAQP